MSGNQKIFRVLVVVVFTFICLSSVSYARQVKVLTYNVGGVFVARYRQARTKLIGPAIAELDPDIVVLQEAFNRSHRQMILKGLDASGYEYKQVKYFNHSYKYGSGLMLITKFPVIKTEMEFYSSKGPPLDFENFAGKGIVHAVLDTPDGPLDLYFTHMVARMSPVFDGQGNYIPGDKKINDRILQGHQVSSYIERTRNFENCSLIAVGDFNVSPEMLEYHYLVSKNRFQNSFDNIHPGKNPSTFSLDNMFVNDDFSRIDHIFYKNFKGAEGFNLAPVSSDIVMKQTQVHPRLGKPINLSDHYGLFTVFEVVGKDQIGLSRKWSPEISGTIVVEPESKLDPTSPESWYEFSESTMMRILDENHRTSELILPMAKMIVGLNKPGETTKIHLNPEQRESLDKLLTDQYSLSFR
jgi:endonuclease/exonuclease/phosphatase family metal-dependent hydrolase